MSVSSEGQGRIPPWQVVHVAGQTLDKRNDEYISTTKTQGQAIHNVFFFWAGVSGLLCGLWMMSCCSTTLVKGVVAKLKWVATGCSLATGVSSVAIEAIDLLPGSCYRLTGSAVALSLKGHVAVHVVIACLFALPYAADFPALMYAHLLHLVPALLYIISIARNERSVRTEMDPLTTDV